MARRTAVDKSTIGGIFIACVGILAGMMIEGGSIMQILQPTAALIVFGGTIGAVMIQFPLPVVVDGAKRFAHVFFEPKEDAKAKIKEIVGYAQKARQEGIVALDSQLGKIEEPFLKKALTLAVDGTEPQELRSIMDVELDTAAEHDEQIPKIFESAGGFSPTVGIIGAVLGLIQVMQHLDKIDEVGRGIAVAFVATIYGVAMANLVCLPAAGKLKLRLRHEAMLRELTLEGVISIMEGMNPRMLESKLYGYLHNTAPPEEPAR
jgi:chemotaxis protein MotA